MKKTVLLALIWVGAMACNKNQEAAPEPTVEITSVPYRQATTVPTSGADLKVDLREIADSRCPKNVVCIQAGDARMKFNVSDGTHQSEVNVIFKGDKKSDFTAFTLNGRSYVLTVSEVLPYPDTNESPKLEDYKVNVAIEKK